MKLYLPRFGEWSMMLLINLEFIFVYFIRDLITHERYEFIDTDIIILNLIWKGLLLNEIYVLGPYNIRSIKSD